MIDETAAREALKALGITPKRDLIKDWIRAAEAEERSEREAAATQAPPPTTPMPTPPLVQSPAQPETQDFRPRHPRGFSKSQLEPTLQQQGTLQRQHGIRKRGRPRVIASWFPAVAKEMAEGTPLKEALRRHGITLDKAQIRAVYRNEEFKRLFREARNTASNQRTNRL